MKTKTNLKAGAVGASMRRAVGFSRSGRGLGGRGAGAGVALGFSRR